MPHDATKIQMGNVPNSCKNIDNIKGDFAAGLYIHKKTDGTGSIAAADGAGIGISVGKDLSNAGYTAVARSGLDIPMQLTAAFTPAIGTQVHISDTTGKAGAAGEGFTGINATYSSEKKIMVAEDGTETADAVALIDMVGGP